MTELNVRTENTGTTDQNTRVDQAGGEVSAADLWVEHSHDGTVLYGTSRDDREVIAALKSRGFRWSRRLEGWYLPRPWQTSTRWQRVKALRADLDSIGQGERLEIEISQEPRRSAAEREAEQRDRAAARAERLATRAEKLQARADAQRTQAEEYLSGIPLGQPNITDTSAGRAFANKRAKMVDKMGRSVEIEREAQEAREAAERAEAAASGRESRVTIGNRIERHEAELRSVRRRIEGTGKAIHGEDKPATGAYRARLERCAAELEDHIDHDRAKLEAAGGIPYSRENVHPGDFVKVRGLWYPVIRSNAKSVSVPHPMADASARWADTTPWREVADHIARTEATPAKLRALATRTPRSFPGLAERLAQNADQLEATEHSGDTEGSAGE